MLAGFTEIARLHNQRKGDFNLPNNERDKIRVHADQSEGLMIVTPINKSSWLEA
jgi:hypothetical protein